MNFIQAKAQNLNMLKSTVEATNHKTPNFWRTILTIFSVVVYNDLSFVTIYLILFLFIQCVKLVRGSKHENLQFYINQHHQLAEKTLVRNKMQDVKWLSRHLIKFKLIRNAADTFCDSVVKMRNEYQVDGIDLDVEDGGTSSELQVYLLRSCRQKLGSDFLIT